MNLWSRFGKAMLVLALALSLGAHWALLQTVAWTGMLISYTRAAGLAAGVAATFDGNHPCRLCRIIQEGRAAEQKPAPQPQPSRVEVEKLLAILTANMMSLRGLAEFQQAAWPGRVPFEWSEPPPTLPPRVAVTTQAPPARSHPSGLKLAPLAPRAYDQSAIARSSLLG